MRSRTAGAVALALLVILVRPEVGAGAAFRLKEAVNDLARGLAAAECPLRIKALSGFFAVPNKEWGRVAEVQKGLAGVDPAIAGRVKMVLDYGQEREKVLSRVLPFEQDLGRISRIADPSQRARKVEELRQRLLKIVRNPKETFLARSTAAGFMITMATEFAEKLTGHWTENLLQLLASPNPQERLIASVFAAGQRFHEGQDPKKGLVIPALLEGLRGQSFVERNDAQQALLLLTRANPQEFCLDPTDPPALRAPAIQRWETWWAQNKDALSDERIPQMN